MTIETKTASTLEVLSLDPLSDQVSVDAWQKLSEAALDPNPFYGPAFLRAFLEHMPGYAARLIVVKDQATGDWLMAAPIRRHRPGILLPVNSSLATDYAPLGTPLLHPEAQENVVSTFFRKASGWQNVLTVPFLPLSSETARRMQSVSGIHCAVTVKTERACHWGGAEGQAQFASAFKGKRRKELRRLLRRLGDDDQVKFEHLSGLDVIEGFEAFLQLEATGWKGRVGTALVNQDSTAAFARKAIAGLAASNNVRLDQLWSGDRLVASIVMIQQRGNSFSWKIAYDEAFSRYSPGVQIAMQAFRQNLEMPGFRFADSLAIPGHAMIEPLWKGRLETGTLLMADGTLGGALQKLCSADIAAKEDLRRRARLIKQRLSA
ncbi:GNAT family N-acetyltransferase [Roseibium sp. SCPC15]|uniref:GNAT family N-acetyltransferase n=1 Tax=Roseibium sp. SCP15 TaxID=3141376 RepID=UPI003334BAF0